MASEEGEAPSTTKIVSLNTIGTVAGKLYRKSSNTPRFSNKMMSSTITLDRSQILLDSNGFLA